MAAVGARVGRDHFIDKLIDRAIEWIFTPERPKDLPHEAPKVISMHVSPKPTEQIGAANKFAPYFQTTFEKMLSNLQRRPRIIVAVTKCVTAAATVGSIVDRLETWADVLVVATEDAIPYLHLQSLENIPAPVEDDRLPSELQTWADILVVAPLSIITIANIATGANDVVTSVVREWDSSKPFIVAPSTAIGWEKFVRANCLRSLEEIKNAEIVRYEVPLICSTVANMWQSVSSKAAR